MWTVCDLCGALVADEALHAAWHYPVGADHRPIPEPEPEPDSEPGTDLIPYPEMEPTHG